MYVTETGQYRNPRPFKFRYVPNQPALEHHGYVAQSRRREREFRKQLRDEAQYGPEGMYEQQLMGQVSHNELERRSSLMEQAYSQPNDEDARERERRQAREFKDSRPDVFFMRAPSGMTQRELYPNPPKSNQTFEEFLQQQAENARRWQERREAEELASWPPIPPVIPTSDTSERLQDIYDEMNANGELLTLNYEANQLRNQMHDDPNALTDLADLYSKFGLGARAKGLVYGDKTRYRRKLRKVY